MIRGGYEANYVYLQDLKMLDKLASMIDARTKYGKFMVQSFLDANGGDPKGPHNLNDFCVNNRFRYSTVANWFKVARASDITIQTLIKAQELTGETDAEFFGRLKESFLEGEADEKKKAGKRRSST